MRERGPPGPPASRPVRTHVIRSGREWVPAVLRYNRIPNRVLVEIANLGNDEDRALVVTRRFRQQVAEAMAAGLMEYFGADGGVLEAPLKPAPQKTTAASTPTRKPVKKKPRIRISRRRPRLARFSDEQIGLGLIWAKTPRSAAEKKEWQREKCSKRDREACLETGRRDVKGACRWHRAGPLVEADTGRWVATNAGRAGDWRAPREVPNSSIGELLDGGFGVSGAPKAPAKKSQPVFRRRVADGDTFRAS